MKARGEQPLGTRIPAGQTWKRLRQMVPEFETRGALARRLGLQTPALQLQTTKVTLRNALKVAQLFHETMTVDGYEGSI